MHTTIKLTSKVSVPLKYHTVFLTETDGYVASPPIGIIFIESGRVYDCTVLNERYLELLDSINDCFIDKYDLGMFVRRGDLTISSPYSENDSFDWHSWTSKRR